MRIISQREEQKAEREERSVHGNDCLGIIINISKRTATCAALPFADSVL